MLPQCTQPPLPLEAEEWRPLLGYEGLYEVSSLGRVRGMPRPHAYPRRADRLLYIGPNRPGPRGYLQVRLCRDGLEVTRKVHRLVAEAFLGPRSAPFEVNHIDGDKTNNRASNLEWVSPDANVRHAYASGLKVAARLTGERNANARLTASAVRSIRQAVASGVTQECLALRYGVNRTTIEAVVTGRSWRHIR
jgi:hypothetical protein